ncbi:hypothetical protein RF11_13556 [Thelohanellus kitauei]|uniref:Uncharacterized protein n=1 Tax=Thelohanellus kitauei TaxID=669202 RepID=A0A0C2JHZ6_THEKT|nr:hypothetical protein RF11_13556 [Thelohanellus kitauei]
MIIRLFTILTLIVFLVLSIGVGVFATILNTIGRDFCPQIAKFNGILVLSLLGFMVAFLNLFGLLGVYRRSKPLKYLFKGVFSLLIIIATVLTIISIDKFDEDDSIFTRCIIFELDLKHFSNMNFIKHLQADNKCCGLTSKENYGVGQYPPSCCENQTSPCVKPYQNPCKPYLIAWLPSIMLTTLATFLAVIYLSPIIMVAMILENVRLM